MKLRSLAANHRLLVARKFLPGTARFASHVSDFDDDAVEVQVGIERGVESSLTLAKHAYPGLPGLAATSDHPRFPAVCASHDVLRCSKLCVVPSNFLSLSPNARATAVAV